MPLRLNGNFIFPRIKRLYSVTSPDVCSRLTPRTLSNDELLESKQLDNGSIITSLDDKRHSTLFGVVFNAGCRYERPDQRGITHLLRIMASRANKRMSAIGLSRLMGQYGADVSCITSRDSVTYMVKCQRLYQKECMTTLRRITTLPAFKYWEIWDAKPQLEYDLAVLADQPNIRMMEKLHEVAFREDLGNSLYIPEFNLGRFETEHLSEFYEDHYTESNVSIIGLGMDFEEMENVCNEYQFKPKKPLEKKLNSQFHSGEFREFSHSPTVYAALCTKGVGYDSDDLYNSLVLQEIMGTGPSIKWNYGNYSARLGKITADNTSNTVTCVNFNYSNSGLFGFALQVDATEVEKVMKAALNEFKEIAKGNISDEEIQIGKIKAKTKMFYNLENPENYLMDLGRMTLARKNISALNRAELIDGVTPDGLHNFAKNLMSGKMAMSAIGDLKNTPYLDEILK